MSSPDYPLLSLPSYEMYQIAQIATFIAEALARYRAAGNRNGARWTARRDIAGGRVAYDRFLGTRSATPPEELPRPIDAEAYRAARAFAAAGPREAEVVSLAPTGRPGWAVVGQVPGIGAVGAITGTRAVADAIRQHILTQPVEELGTWAVSESPLPTPKLPSQIDVAAFVENLDPQRERSRAIAGPLRGLSARIDAAIRGRFRGVDLDAPFVVTPPQPSRTATPAHATAAASRHICGLGHQVTTARAPSVPSRSGGP